MFDDIKIPSSRILLTHEFVDFLTENYLKIFNDWLKYYPHEYSSYGLEFFRFNKEDEFLLGDYLMDFLHEK